MLLGVHLTLLIGKTIATPAPVAITEALSAVQVTQSETGRSGFTLTFQVGRSGPLDLFDYGLLTHPLLRPFVRVVVMVRFNLTPTVLLDGVITQLQLTPSEEPGGSTLTVTGEEVSMLMDVKEDTESYANLNGMARLLKVLARYAALGLTPDPGEALASDQSVSTVSIPKKNGTDYSYLQDLAAGYHYVFYVRPGLLPNTNVAYLGPSGQLDRFAALFPPPPLSVNMGPQTNVNSINFSYGGVALEQVKTTRSEPLMNRNVPVVSLPISTDPPQAAMPPAVYQLGTYRIVRADQPLTGGFGSGGQQTPIRDGLMVPQAFVDAQRRTNASSQKVVTATGEVDGLRYGAVLLARSTVDVRGVGATFDGRYYVPSVTHSIRKGEYKQQISLQRSGVYPLSPFVRV
jgi:hypothetical protein